MEEKIVKFNFSDAMLANSIIIHFDVDLMRTKTLMAISSSQINVSLAQILN